MVVTRSHQPQLLSGRADSNMSPAPLILFSLISLTSLTVATHNYDRSTTHTFLFLSPSCPLLSISWSNALN